MLKDLGELAYPVGYCKVQEMSAVIYWVIWFPWKIGSEKIVLWPNLQMNFHAYISQFLADLSEILKIIVL